MIQPLYKRRKLCREILQVQTTELYLFVFAIMNHRTIVLETCKFPLIFSCKELFEKICQPFLFWRCSWIIIHMWKKQEGLVSSAFSLLALQRECENIFLKGWDSLGFLTVEISYSSLQCYIFPPGWRASVSASSIFFLIKINFYDYVMDEHVNM